MDPETESHCGCACVKPNRIEAELRSKVTEAHSHRSLSAKSPRTPDPYPDRSSEKDQSEPGLCGTSIRSSFGLEARAAARRTTRNFGLGILNFELGGYRLLLKFSSPELRPARWYFGEGLRGGNNYADIGHSWILAALGIFRS
jgi:hypothetical protein